MNRSFIFKTSGACLAAFALAMLPSLSLAGPGAHGPNGEHLDSPQGSHAGAAQNSPRIEAKSDLFELVGTLGGGELSILIDRFESNEPLLQAQVEIESGGLKAQAKFHHDMGDFSVDDPAMLKLLSTPGDHPLVITILAGQDGDLLDAVLRVEASSSDHAHGTDWRLRAWGAVVTVLLMAAGLRYQRSRQKRSSTQGANA
jgi:hypothetical protein